MDTEHTKMTDPASAIEVRRIPFEFDAQIDPLWHPAQPEWSHMVNGASLVMPYLEPFLIRTIRAALPQIEDDDLRADAASFVQQEAQHFTNHRRYNEMLKAAGYVELAEVEADMEATYARFERRSLLWRLAYTAGFESMTMGITDWLLSDREALFAGSDPIVRSLVLWHMVEEAEHKTVAIDVYRALGGGWALRVLGLLYASLHVGLLSRRGYKRMLERDGRWRSLRSRLRLWRWVARFVGKAAPAMLGAMKPGHDPRDVTDPPWIDAWRGAWAQLEGEALPVVSDAALRAAPSASTSAFFQPAH